MITIDNILSSIDKTKMETKFVDIYPMCESEFEIYEYVWQPENNMRLTYCYFHSWICTDTMVGIRVWYLDGNPVCISSKPYRKYDEEFMWLSKECFDDTRAYVMSLVESNDIRCEIASDEKINDVINSFEKIDYKEFEKFNKLAQ